MTTQEVINKVTSLKKGAITNVIYKSEVPVRAAHKNNISITKVTEAQARFGIDYDNIASVVERRRLNEEAGIEKRQVTNNYTWVVENYVKHNEKTGLDYLVCFTVPNTKAISTYQVIDTTAGRGAKAKTLTKEQLMEEYSEIITGSYFNKKPNAIPTEVKNIKIENIISIG